VIAAAPLSLSYLTARTRGAGAGVPDLSPCPFRPPYLHLLLYPYPYQGASPSESAWWLRNADHVSVTLGFTTCSGGVHRWPEPPRRTTPMDAYSLTSQAGDLDSFGSRQGPRSPVTPSRLLELRLLRP
jgi:hypothetical protein